MVVGALSGGVIAWLTYKLEVKPKIRKHNRLNLMAKIGVAVGLGALSGGLGGLGKVGGFLNKAIKYGYLSSK